MKYQEKVECAQDKAQEEFDNCMGDILDSTKEQLETDRANGFYCHNPKAKPSNSNPTQKQHIVNWLWV